MKSIKSAKLINYNANASGRRTADCVKRSISTAFHRDYNQVSKDLIAKMKELRRDKWNIAPVYGKVIADYGGSKYITLDGEFPYLEDFVDNTLGDTGTYLVITGGTKRHSDHIVAVIDGEIYDTWNSTKQYVFGYYVVSTSANEVSKSDASMEEYTELVQDKVYAEIGIAQKKYKWASDLFVNLLKIVVTSINACQVTLKVALEPCEYAQKRSYTLKFGVTFRLSDDDAAIQTSIKNQVKIRMYDRMYAINQKEEMLQETFNERQTAGVSDEFEQSWITPQEQKYYNTLPAWVRARLLYLAIDMPGRYSDSYRITIRPLPWDTDALTNRRIFKASTSSEMKQILDAYYNDHEILEW